MITQQTIQQIQSRVEILDVVGTFVKLKRRGSNYLGLCPFHNEKTPSFTVSPSKEIFKCFGCGKSGNSISFVMEHEKLSYVEALRWLAAKYDIEVEETESSPEKKQQAQTAESLYILNAFAQKFYAEQLTQSEAGQAAGMSYLKDRGFGEAIIQKFGLGYAPDSKDALTGKALKEQYSAELLQKAGLSTERYGQLADNYRDRIVFPIHNPSGKIIGFGARLLKKNDKAPKYINTPENELYVKSKILYGTYFARQAIDRADECLLVEGYTDVISLHEAGIENVVASGGTSLTQDQLRLIKKYTSNLTIIYDGDAAGIKAALRGLDMALEESLSVKLVLIPDGEDPDSYVRKVGAEAFRTFVQQNKKDFVFFQLQVLLKEAGDDPQKKSDVVNNIAETISKIDKAEDFTKQQDYIRQCAQQLHIDEGGFTALVNKFIRNKIAAQEKLPFEEAKVHEERAQRGEDSNFDDATFSLLYKDELQEREIVRILLEHGTKQYNKEELVAEHVLAEMPEDDLIENKVVLQFLHLYRTKAASGETPPDKSYFIYNTEPTLSTLAVSLLQTPYEQSEHWKKNLSQSSGFQKSLFQQDYSSFIKSVQPGNEETLMGFLKMQEDKTMDEVDSAINYLKLRKVKRMLLQNQADMEKADAAEQMTLFRTHLHLKQMEMELSKKIGSVVIK